MSVNRYQPHLLVLPEDDANRQLVNGFLTDPSLNLRVVQVLPPAGGWSKVHNNFLASHLSQLRKYQQGHLVLLIDFDDQIEDRTNYFKDAVPSDVADRIYLLGTSGEPEPLRKSCGISLEKIGERLANACSHDEGGLWEHELLQHNQAEVERLVKNVKPFLFS